MRKMIAVLLLLGSFPFPVMANDASCQALRADLKTAADILNKASLANNINDAKRAMDKGKHAINTVAADARDCPCNEAADQFDSAAAKFRRASIAGSVGEYNEYTRQGVKEYGAAINALNSCPASQQAEQIQIEQPQPE